MCAVGAFGSDSADSTTSAANPEPESAGSTVALSGPTDVEATHLHSVQVHSAAVMDPRDGEPAPATRSITSFSQREMDQFVQR